MEAIKERTWEECVAEARKYVATIKQSRIEIAKLAIEACDIKVGNTHRDGPSLTQFAKEIGVSQPLLTKWVNSYKYGIKKDIIPFRGATDQDLKKAMRAHTNRPQKEKGHDRTGRPGHEIVKTHATKLLSNCKSSLNQFERYKDSDLKKIPQGIKNELVVKLNRIILLLKNS